MLRKTCGFKEFIHITFAACLAVFWPCWWFGCQKFIALSFNSFQEGLDIAADLKRVLFWFHFNPPTLLDILIAVSFSTIWGCIREICVQPNNETAVHSFLCFTSLSLILNCGVVCVWFLLVLKTIAKKRCVDTIVDWINQPFTKECSWYLRSSVVYRGIT